MIKVIKSAARKMLIDFEDSRNISHNPTKGRAREYFIVESFLKPYIPARYSIGSGIIIDADQKDSRQQDLVIYDRFYSSVLLDIDSDQIFFPESVFVTIEVKSRMGNVELCDIVKKSGSVWGLSKTPSPQIVLSPGSILTSQHPPTLCAGICFESSLAIEDIPMKVREARSLTEYGHALSIVCVLKDKNGKAGVILNVSQENLSAIRLIPSVSTRLATIQCETEGDALLYTYLLIMEHLRTSGAITPGPNLLHYAKTAGLGEMNLNLSNEEMKGASFEADGKKIEVDVAMRLSELTRKVLGEHSATDDEILELFYYIPNMPAGETLLHPNAVFKVDGKIYDIPGPLTIHEAIVRKQNDVTDQEDDKLLQRFIKLIRSVGFEHENIEMGIF